jgi:hypothetical protein
LGVRQTSFSSLRTIWVLKVRLPEWLANHF